jgi:hypothetical protein
LFCLIRPLDACSAIGRSKTPARATGQASVTPPGSQRRRLHLLPSLPDATDPASRPNHTQTSPSTATRPAGGRTGSGARSGTSGRLPTSIVRRSESTTIAPGPSLPRFLNTASNVATRTDRKRLRHPFRDQPQNGKNHPAELQAPPGEAIIRWCESSRNRVN